jgi:histidyl-tRNA synthetase
MLKKKLSTEPYKGMRDFYPEDMAVQKYIFETMKDVVESYGYLEYSAPLIEETDLYRAKTGEEIVTSQTYAFEDRGGRDVTIRPEMTPSIARMIARKRKELTFPLRWYSIPNLFRYENPQRGRLREHYQLNVDIFGVESTQADIEAISMSFNIMSAFGADPKNFIIKVNDRRIINYVLSTYLDLDEDTAYKVSKLIDKKDKMSDEEFMKQSLKLIGEKNTKLIDHLNQRDLTKLSSEVKKLEAVSDLLLIQEGLKRLGVNTVYDPTLMRGFDYYTKNNI